MQLIKSIPVLRETLRSWRHAGEIVAFVPTMGNLHAGHLRLVEQARSMADRVVASIFVNPTQFSAGEDFGAYPRTPEADIEKLTVADVDLLFMPEADEIYPPSALSHVEVPGLSEQLCGAVRPGHFRGVATVVGKLFNLVQPDVALFGEKDWQQLVVIRRMVADLNFPVRIVGVPTVREADGLAMSSRNSYLSEDARRQASLLYQSLLAVQAELHAGRRDFADMEAEQLAVLQAAGFKPDYLAIRQLDLSLPVEDAGEFVVLVAAWLGRARLIDNLRVRVEA